MRRCSRCVEPETAPKIEFDENGVCNYCNMHKKFTYLGEEKLKKILDSKRRPDNKYDCIVALSGGRDSSYVLLKMVKDYKMKVLAVNYQNPFTHPQATKNILNATKALNVDLVSVKDKNNRHVSTFKNNVKAWFKNPSPAMISMVCVACKPMMWLAPIQVAREYDIHCIISGYNRFELASFKRELLNVSTNEERSNVYTKIMSGVFRELIKNPRYLNPVCIPSMIRMCLFTDEYRLGSKIMGYNMDKIAMFEYIPWNEEDVMSRITNELNWDYPHGGGTWRFDCTVEHLRQYMYLMTLKMTEREDFYSMMIREGAISREEALKRLETENTVHMKEIEEVLEKAGISDHEFIKTGLDNP